MKRYLTAHLPVGLGYFGVVLGLRLLGGEWREGWGFWVRAGWLLAGILTGVWLLFLDRVVYTYAYPSEQLSQHFVYLWKQKRYREALELLDARRGEQVRLAMRSVLFMVAWVPLAFFGLTSTITAFGRGVVMGVMVHILYDAWRLQRVAPERLNARLFWPIKRQVSREEQMVFLVVMTVVFVWLTGWV